MIKNKERMRWIVTLTLCATAVLLFLRMVIIWRDVDPSTGLFRAGAGKLCALYNVAGVVLLAALLVGALVVQSRRKKKKPAPTVDDLVREIIDRNDPLFTDDERPMGEEEIAKDSPDTYADVCNASTWEGTLSAFSYTLPGFCFLLFAYAFIRQGNRDVLTILYSALSVLCGAYFLLMGIRNRAAKNVPLAFFGLIPAAWATLRMIIEYRDVDQYANRDLYTANLIFLIAVVCFFVYQAQVTLGLKTYSMPLSWFAASLLVVALGLSARLPQLVGLVAGRLGALDRVQAVGLLLDLSITFFAGLKIRGMLQ